MKVKCKICGLKGFFDETAEPVPTVTIPATNPKVADKKTLQRLKDIANVLKD